MRTAFSALLALALVLTAAMPTSALAQSRTPFSSSLLVHEDEVLVGAPSDPHAPGRVYVFAPDADGVWSRTAALEAADGERGDGFGTSIAALGDRLVVGAPDVQAAYVFARESNGSWSESARLTPPDSLEGFGTSVATSGSRIAVGAASQSTMGAVYVYETTGDGSWSGGTLVSGSDVESGEGFGSTLALHDDHLIVGSPASRSGTVYAFRYTGDTWKETGRVVRDRLTRGANFGAALHLQAAAEGEMPKLMVGAPREAGRVGAVYTFGYDAGTDVWRESGRLLPFDGDGQHLFGASIATSDNDVWVGAPGASDRDGALYRFARNDEGTITGVTRHGTDDDGTLLGASLAAGPGHVVAGQPRAAYGAGLAALFQPSDDAAENASWSFTTSLDPGPSGVLSAKTGERIRCTDGTIGRFSCEQVDMTAYLPVHEIGGTRGVRVNDIWGWTDPETGREYALVGRINGTSFVDVSDPLNPVYLGDLPMTEGSSAQVWRDIKVYADHAFIVADNAGKHGMQVFDLTQLRDVTADEQPVTFEATTLYERITSAHNVVVNEDTGFAYIVGAGGGGETCGGGLHMVDVRTPAEPTFAGCFADPSTGRTGTGYTHDAQCVIYEGPDTEHQGKEICFGANETALSIADVSDKENPVSISTGSYPDHAYVHQGWLTEDQSYFYLNDELDEINGLVDSTRTLVWDVSDLDDPQLVKEFLHSVPSSDHNLYVRGDRMYQSNYQSGLRVIDVSNPAEPAEVGHFDTVPFGDNSAGFGGSWSNYPFFESGTIIVTSGNEGLFVLKRAEQGL